MIRSPFSNLLLALLVTSALGLVGCAKKKSSSSQVTRGKSQNKPQSPAPAPAPTPPAPREGDVTGDNNPPRLTGLAGVDAKPEASSLPRQRRVNPPQENSKGASSGLNPSSLEVGPDQSVSDSERAQSQACQELEGKLKSLGWVAKDLRVPEDIHSPKGPRVLIRYYKLESSKLQNPVLFIGGQRGSVDAKRLELFKKLSETYDFDPLLLDTRGAGCSSPLPDVREIQRWQHYGSRAYAHDAHLIRTNEKLKVKWRLWAHQSAGPAAFRAVELYPQELKSIHVTDFIPFADSRKLMWARSQAQLQAWEDFIAYATEDKKIPAQELDLDKARKTLKTQWPCKDTGASLCGEGLLDLFTYLLRSSAQWDESLDLLKALVLGEKDHQQLLSTQLRSRESVHFSLAAFRRIDLEADLEQRACLETVERMKKDEALRLSAINSCRVELALGKKDFALLTKLRHDPFQVKTIQENLKKHKIDYYWMLADASLSYPLKAGADHAREFRSYFKNEDTLHKSQDLQVDEDPEFLETLRGRE
ncbi:MAG: hypothetical protein ACK5Y2_01260 [Bdellovibrionales bacterium]